MTPRLCSLLVAERAASVYFVASLLFAHTALIVNDTTLHHVGIFWFHSPISHYPNCSICDYTALFIFSITLPCLGLSQYPRHSCMRLHMDGDCTRGCFTCRMSRLKNISWDCSENLINQYSRLHIRYTCLVHYHTKYTTYVHYNTLPLLSQRATL